MKVINIATGEVKVCRGCKGDQWIILSSNAKTVNKYICNNCGNARTMYTYPPEYKHG